MSSKRGLSLWTAAVMSLLALIANCSDSNLIPCTESSTCPDELPICDESIGGCNSCTEDDECVSEQSLPTCNTATGQCLSCDDDTDCEGVPGKEVCKTDTNACVECLENADCTDSANPRCDTEENTCGPCLSDSDCAAFGTACRPDQTCGTALLGSVRTCALCEADTECQGANDRCVPLSFGDPLENGDYCMTLQSAGCVEPFGVVLLEDLTSVSGEPEADYCGINTSILSCDAVRGLIDDASCPGGADNECAGFGALCRMVGAADNKCTYGCSVNGECPAAFDCNNSYCGG